MWSSSSQLQLNLSTRTLHGRVLVVLLHSCHLLCSGHLRRAAVHLHRHTARQMMHLQLHLRTQPLPSNRSPTLWHQPQKGHRHSRLMSHGLLCFTGTHTHESCNTCLHTKWHVLDSLHGGCLCQQKRSGSMTDDQSHYSIVHHGNRLTVQT